MTKKIDCPKCNGSGKLPDPKAIGAEMRTLRMRCGVSLRAVARVLKLSAPYLSDLEQGRRRWQPAMQTKFCGACNKASFAPARYKNGKISRKKK